jgi:NADPH:quinone reductase-like Zn-dependent oxidoreductase
MKAFGLADADSPAVILEVPTPEVGPSEVRVRVVASSVNGWDAFVASGMARASMEHRYPVVVGKDYAGVIESVGEGVTSFAVGDEVAGIVPPEPYLSRGSYAEYLVVPAGGYIERKPTNLDLEQAASVGLAALTALVAVDAIDPSEGDLALVVGATGGVGAYAVQLAAARGATVIATGLPEDEAWMRGLGAAEVVDYSGDVAAIVREQHPEGVDALIDAVHLGDGFGPIAELVKDGGKIATTVGAADVEALAGRGVDAANVFAQTDAGPFATVVRMAAEGSLTVPVTRTFTFEELPEALGLVGKRRSRGKVAVTIGG